jgi:hypothetical protein
MTLLRDLQKQFKVHHGLALLGAVLLIYLVFRHSGEKSDAVLQQGMKGSRDSTSPTPQQVWDDADAGTAQPADPMGENSQFSAVSMPSGSAKGLPPSCSAGNVPDASDLLPKDQNNEWARLNPSGSQDFQNVNLLKAGYHTGIDTVASSLRNANLQLRSEPPNPTSKVSPWLNTTIEPDLMRVPLEIGCGPQ